METLHHGAWSHSTKSIKCAWILLKRSESSEIRPPVSPYSPQLSAFSSASECNPVFGILWVTLSQLQPSVIFYFILFFMMFWVPRVMVHVLKLQYRLLKLCMLLRALTPFGLLGFKVKIITRSAFPKVFLFLWQVLLVSSSRHPDQWIVPGGGMEPEEEPCGAAVREVFEEVNKSVPWLCFNVI